MASSAAGHFPHSAGWFIHVFGELICVEIAKDTDSRGKLGQMTNLVVTSMRSNSSL